MKGVFSQTKQLLKESWNVLKSDKKLLLIPIIPVILAIFFIGIGLYFAISALRTGKLEATLFPFISLLIVSLFVFVVGTFFNVILFSCVNDKFKGKEASFKRGLSIAVKNFKKVIGWIFISTGVHTTFSVASREGVAKIAAETGRTAWRMMTTFVVPVMVFENIGISEAVGKSVYLFTKTWGPTVVGRFSIGLILFIKVLIAAGLGFGLSFLYLELLYLEALPFESIIPIAILWGVLIAYIIISGVVISVLGGIFNIALYHYASTGQIPSGFSSKTIRNAYSSKGSTGAEIPENLDEPYKPKPKSKKKLFIVIGIIILVLVFVIGGVVVWQYLKILKEEQKILKIEPLEDKIESLGDTEPLEEIEETEPLPVIKPLEGVLPGEILPEEEIADWKTYTNEEYGFEIKYPIVFEDENIVLVTKNEAFFPYLAIGKETIEYRPKKLTLAFIYLPTNIKSYYGHAPYQSIISVDDWINAYITGVLFLGEPGHGGTDSCYKKIIAGYNGAICEGSTIGVIPVWREARVYFIVTPKGGFEVTANIIGGYEIIGSSDEIIVSREKINSFFVLVIQILSTFKFLE